jgi:hypothetical protein
MNHSAAFHDTWNQFRDYAQRAMARHELMYANITFSAELTILSHYRGDWGGGAIVLLFSGDKM